MSLGLPVDVIFLFAGIQSTSVIYNLMEAIAWGKGTAPSKQKVSIASSLGSYLKTAMIITLLLWFLSIFISLPSLAFPQNIVERQCCSYWFLFAHVNDTAPSSGDSVLKSLIKCHGLWAYGLCSLPGSSNWQQGSSSTPWREIFLKSENAVLLSHDKNHWSAYVQLYIAFPYSSHPICNPLLAIMLQ